MIDSAEYLKLLIALVAIVDIPGNVPIFLQQTGRLSGGGARITALIAALATGAILLIFAFFGEEVLGVFGITIEAFKVLGGLVVLIIALNMLGLLREEEELERAAPGDNNAVTIGIFPLAVPLFAGPGAITAVMVYGHEEFHSKHDLIMTAVIASTAGALLLGLLLASTLRRLISPVVQVVLNRLLGMIVGALGVEFILEGLAGFFPGLGG